MSDNPILTSLTAEQGDVFERAVVSLAKTVEALNEMDPAVVSKAPSVLDAHENLKKAGYRGKVDGPK